MYLLMGAGSAFGFLEEYVMFGKNLPSWMHWVILLALLVPLLNSGAVLVGRFLKSAPTVSAETGGVAVAEKANTGPIETNSVSAAPASVGGQAKVVAATTYEDKSKTEDNRKQTNVFGLINVINGGDNGIDATIYEADVETAEGLEAKVKVHVLWKDASWYFGSTSFNRRKLIDYLRTPEYQREMRSATAIACVGLSSYWSDTANTTPVSSLSDGSQHDVEATTDDRASTLCNTLSERARQLNVRPQFFGMGLGYNIDQPATKTQEQQQRALVILHIDAGSSKRLSPKQVQSLLMEVMKSDTIKEFEGDRYSRVVDGRQICWTESVHGIFIASDLKCDE